MSILVKGITMPTYDYIDIRIFQHGKAEINKIRTATRWDGTPAFYKTLDVVELPPHGDLIDRDAALYALCEAVHKTDAGIPCANQIVSCTWGKTRVQDYAEKILVIPTIIEAEEVFR